MNWLRFAFCALFCGLPLLYLGAIWNSLPPIVPTHFDATGSPNGFSSREALWAINGGLAALTLGMYLLFANLHRIDPKRAGKGPAASFVRLGDGMVLFLTVLNFITILSSSGHDVAINRLVFPLVGLLFAFLGNVMYSIKPNSFAGIRVPWTLEDDDNWRATHRVAGVVWFVGGLTLGVGSLLIQEKYTHTLLFAALVPMTLIPVAYSFWYFKHSAEHKS
jgi:uncharacterized membrane protein